MTSKREIAGINLPAIGRGTLAGAVASLGATLLAACLFFFTNISETLFPYLVSFILFLSGVLGGALASRAAGNKGLFHGAAVGLALFLLLWLAAAGALPGPVTATMLLKKLFLLVAGGATGGFIGIALVP